MTRIIMGIDPGSRLMGYGFIQIENNQVCYLDSGVVKATEANMPERLRILFAGMQELIQTYKPTEIAIEKVFVHINPASAITLGQARGVAIAASFEHDLKIYEYSARQIKQAVVGYGNADKVQVSQMISRLLNLKNAPAVDASDALACALCHFYAGVSR